LGSVEIGNAGVSPSTVVPVPSPYPPIMGNGVLNGVPCSTTGMLISSTGC
jgi:hypothetical protein